MAVFLACCTTIPCEMSHDAIDELTPYYNSVLRFIRSFGFSADEARDIAQDVFARVSKHKEQFRGDSRWTFLQTTARYDVFNAIRKKKAAMRDGKEVSMDDLPHLPESLAENPWTGQSAPSPEDEVIEREQTEIRARRLAAAIENLGQITRTCLRLWLGGLKYREIATTMDLTIDAVKSRLHEARTELRERLHEDPGGIRWPAPDTEDES